MKDEALRLALEALKTCQIDGDGWSGPHYDFDDVKVGKAIAAIKQALEQPVATNDTSKDRVDETAKQRHEPEPKCVAIVEVFGKDWRLEFMSLPVGKHKLYTQQYTHTSPPKREPLTDEQIEALRRSDDLFEDAPMWRLIARAIEAAHGIKGEA